MKIDVNYEILHKAIYKFKNNEELTSEEKNCLLELIKASEKDYYPSKAELIMHEANTEMLKKVDIHRNKDFWNTLMENCMKFEDKYC